jgi:hypothetical protein
MIPWVATGLAAAGAWAWKYRLRIAAWGSGLLLAMRMRWLRRRVARLLQRVEHEQAVIRTYEEHETIDHAHAETDREIRRARTPDDLNRIVDRLRQAP